jgi:peptide/nickel transport system permease protein
MQSLIRAPASRRREAIEAVNLNQKKGFLYRFSRNKMAMIGLVLFVLELLIFFVGPVILKTDPNAIGSDGFNAAPSAKHWLGTDTLGRDCFARLLYGGRTSLIIGICSMIIGVLLGSVLGLLAGYYRGACEAIIMRLADIFMSFPTMILALVMVAVVGSSMGTVIGVIGVLEWPGIAKLLYGNVIANRNQEYVEASRVMGMKNLRIILRDILPNSITPLLMAMPFRMSHAILTESSLSFLGAGIKAPLASWGNIIYEAQNLTVLKLRPWIWIPPGLCLIVTVVAINLLGEGLRAAMDPKAQK